MNGKRATVALQAAAAKQHRQNNLVCVYNKKITIIANILYPISGVGNLFLASHLRLTREKFVAHETPEKCNTLWLTAQVLSGSDEA
jgi:hypothetical protein